MMRTITGAIIYFLLSLSCLAQKEDRIWIFGDHGGIDFRDTSNVVSFYSGLNGYYTAYPFGSISDKDGNLLFYAAPSSLNTRSTKVFNRNDSIMMNGSNIEGHPSQTQGLLILPFPGDSTRYYLFTKDQLASKIYLYYSIVDMTLDNGLGGVVSKNTVIPCDSLTQRTTAVKHANGRDWWLIVQRYDQDEYLKFLITPSGIQGPYRQTTNNQIPKDGFYGTSYFSRSGNKLVSVGVYGNVDIMDFDRCTGTISNFQRIGENVFSNQNSYFGCAFSPNEQVLYVNNSYPNPGKYIYQYDLTAPDIKASKTIINLYPDTGLLVYVQYSHMLLGADNRIYVSKGNGSGPNSNTIYTQNIDVIMNPDVVGTGCDYRSNFLNLNGGRTTYGLPNMVNFGLGPVTGSVCDSLSTGITEHKRKTNPFVISPNPFIDKITIFPIRDFTFGKPFHVTLLNNTGQVVLYREMQSASCFIPADGLTPGVYVLQVRTGTEIFSAQVVKVE